MATKLISVLMLALLVLPSCCCLEHGGSKESKQEECGSKCCGELGASLPAPKAPLGGGQDPCDCEQLAGQVLGLPGEGVALAAQVGMDFTTEWREIGVPAFFQLDTKPEFSVVLTMILPPGRRFWQDYCVYLI